MKGFHRGFEQLLEWIVMLLMITLAVEVTVGVIFRYSGYSLAWYDEVASILLAWVTYYGAALAAIKRAHIGVPELAALLPRAPRLALALLAEAFVFAFMLLLAWTGYSVLAILSTDMMVSIPEVSAAWTNSVIPVSAVLFIVARALVLPEVIREARAA